MRTDRTAVPLAALVVALAVPLGTLAADAPPALQETPRLDDGYPSQGVVDRATSLRAGPDTRKPELLVLPRGTLVAVDPERAGKFMRVRLAAGATGFVPRDDLVVGDGAGPAWEARAPVAALEKAPPPMPLGGNLPRAHDGLLVRLEAGVGKVWSNSGSDPGIGASFEGRAWLLALTVGTASRERVHVGGQLWLASSFDGSAELVSTRSGLTSIRPVEGRLGLLGLGVCLTVYTESNLYLSVAPGVVLLWPGVTALRYTLASPAVERPFDPGIGLGGRLSVGGEWWVSDDHGLGLSLGVLYAHNAEKAQDLTWDTWLVTAGLSITRS